MQRTASFISLIGHPFITIPVFSVFICWRMLSYPLSLYIGTALIAGVILPVVGWTIYRVRNGTFTDADVSDQTQRRMFFPLLLVLLAVFAAYAWLMNSPVELIKGTISVTVLLLVCYLTNFVLKVSLHAAISIFMSIIIFSIFPASGLGLMMFSMVIAISRLIIRRHSLVEVLTGLAFGALAGAAAIYS